MVTERALAQRINRALAKQDECLKKSRPDTRMEREYGTYYSAGCGIRLSWPTLRASKNVSHHQRAAS